MEFGCGTAPITSTLFELHRPAREIEITISDIQTVAFHYGAYKFRECSNVHPVLLRPEKNFLPEPVAGLDAIFCKTVFEHLPRPLDVVEAFHRMLGPHGLLMFDYIRSEGGGLDTAQSSRQRQDVLAYIVEHFEIVHGDVNTQGSTGLTVARKK